MYVKKIFTNLRYFRTVRKNHVRSSVICKPAVKFANAGENFVCRKICDNVSTIKLRDSINVKIWYCFIKINVAAAYKM